MKYSIIVPCYNEARNLPHSAHRLLDALEEGLREDYEVVFVCDGATDDTLDRLLALDRPRVRVEHYPDNRGKGHAVRYGMLRAKGDIRLFCDCDLAYGTDAVLSMLQKMDKEQADVCVASRRIHPEGYEGYSFSRKLMSGVYYHMIRLLTGLKVSDSQSGLKAFSAKAAEAIFPLCEVNRFAFDLEVLLFGQKLGFLVSEMPAKIIENSPSSIGLSDPFKMVGDMLNIRKRVKKVLRSKNGAAQS